MVARMSVAEAIECEQRLAVVAEIFAYMERRGIRRSWLADQLGISRQRVWQYEHYDTLPPEWFIPKACKALEVLPERFGYTTRPAKTTTRRAG